MIIGMIALVSRNACFSQSGWVRESHKKGAAAQLCDCSLLCVPSLPFLMEGFVSGLYLSLGKVGLKFFTMNFLPFVT